jgi:hypothetical protein
MLLVTSQIWPARIASRDPRCDANFATIAIHPRAASNAAPNASLTSTLRFADSTVGQAFPITIATSICATGRTFFDSGVYAQRIARARRPDHPIGGTGVTVVAIIGTVAITQFAGLALAIAARRLAVAIGCQIAAVGTATVAIDAIRDRGRLALRVALVSATGELSHRAAVAHALVSGRTWMRLALWVACLVVAK